MADNGASIFNDFLDAWSNIGNLFAVFILAGLIPFLKWINNKLSEYFDNKKTKQTEYIKTVTKDITKPMNDKMFEMEEILKKHGEQNEALIENVEKIKAAIDQFTEVQRPINTKVDYIDSILRRSIRFDQSPDDQHKEDEDEQEDYYQDQQQQQHRSRNNSNNSNKSQSRRTRDLPRFKRN